MFLFPYKTHNPAHGVIGLSRLTIRFNQYDPNTLVKESETEYSFGQISHESMKFTQQRISDKNISFNPLTCPHQRVRAHPAFFLKDFLICS